MLQFIKTQRRSLIWFCLIVGLWLGWRTAEPWIYVEIFPHGNSADRLVRMGPRAVGPILAKIKRESPWSKSTASLPIVLSKIGEPAHQQLLVAIDKEEKPSSKIYFIYCLQDVFNDYSRLPIWLELIKKRPSTYSFLKPQLINCVFDNEDRIDIEKIAALTPPSTPKAPNTIVLEMPEIFVEPRKGGRASQFNPTFIKWYKLMSGPNGPLPPINNLH